MTTEKEFCFLCQLENHSITTCDRFLELSATDIVKAASEVKICFKCLRGTHRAVVCKLESQCRVEGCEQKQHTLFHGAERVFPVKTNVRVACVPYIKSEV